MTTDPRFARLLKERIGLDAESVGDAVIERAVRQRCNKVSGGNGEHYWMLLQGSTEEVQALIEAVIVPETWFFRYPESFGALADLASRRVLELAGSRPLRVLSLPCSTGEEPYSIVMALLDAGLAPSAFQVDALDVSRAVLERAEEGRYGRNSFRGSSLEFRDRHFSADGNDYQLAEAVRRKVRFRVGNLLAQGLLAGEAPYDFVFCRNLLIYFDRPTQERGGGGAVSPVAAGWRAVHRPGRGQPDVAHRAASAGCPAILRLPTGKRRTGSPRGAAELDRAGADPTSGSTQTRAGAPAPGRQTRAAGHCACR